MANKKSGRLRLWNFINPVLIFFIDVVKLLFYVLGLVLAAALFAISAYWLLGFANVTMLGTGFLLLPIAESEPGLGGAGVNVAQFIQDKYNFIADFGTEVVQCVEIAGDLWNRVVAFVLGLARRAGEVFGLSFPQWEDFRAAGDTPSKSIPLYDFVARMAEDEAAHAPPPGEAGHGAAQQRLWGLEARARLLAIRIARTLNPRNERISIPAIIGTVCNILRNIVKVVVDILTNVIEFALFILDFIIDIIGVLFTDNDLTFAQVLVKVIIEIILSILDPCNCFGGFPGNFPRSIFKCICFWEYDRDSAVPDNLINAIFGCPCPGFDITGITSIQDVYDQIISPCFRIDFIRIIFEILQTGVDLVLGAIDIIIQIKDGILSAVGWLLDLIDDVEDFFRRKRSFTCNGGDYWCEVESRRINDEEFALMFKMWHNTTGELVSDRSARMPTRMSFRHVLENPLVIGDLGSGEARLLFEEMKQVREVEEHARNLNFQFYDEFHKRINAAKNASLEAQMARDERMWNEHVTRALPEIPCPLPIEKEVGARFMGDLAKKRRQTAADPLEQARGTLLRSDMWAYRMRSVKNYFMDGLADRLQYAALKAVADLHHTSLAREAETPATPEMAVVLRTGRDLLRHLYDVLSASEAPTPEQVYERLREVPLEEAAASLERSARGIRQYHGWADDAEVKFDVFASAVSDPGDLPQVVRRHGYSPQNVRSLEEALAMLEGRVEGLEHARSHLDAGDREAAVRVVQERVLGDRFNHFMRASEGPPTRGSVRAAGIGIGVAIGAGGAVLVSIGFIVGAAIVLAPILPLLLILFTVFGLLFLNVFLDLAVDGIQTLFAGGEPQGFDPVASLIALIGPTVLDLYDVDQPTPSDFANLFVDMLELQLDNLEHLASLILRSVLNLVFPFSKPPKPNFDPATGASVEGLVDWIFNRIQCENSVPCSISAGERGANSLGECGCFFQVSGDTFSRRGTYDERCDPGIGEVGRTVCWPFYRKGRFVSGIDIIPGTTPVCEDFHFDTGNHLVAKRNSWSKLIGTWWTNWKAVTRVAMQALAAGQAIPLVGIGAYPIQSFCPCFAPIAGPVFRYTIYTQVLSIFYPTFAEYMLDLGASSADAPLVGGFFGSLVSFFEPHDIDFDRGYCLLFYSGSWFWITGWLLTLAPIVVVAGPLGLWLALWTLWRVVLFPVNYFVYVLLVAIQEGRRAAARNLDAQKGKRVELGGVDILTEAAYKAWRDPLVSEQTPARLTRKIFD